MFWHKNETHFGKFSPLCDEYNSDNITDRASLVEGQARVCFLAQEKTCINIDIIVSNNKTE